MKTFQVTNIQYDTDGAKVDLPKSLTISVPDTLTDTDEIEEFVSDEISRITGFCHEGFNTVPEIRQQREWQEFSNAKALNDSDKTGYYITDKDGYIVAECPSYQGTKNAKQNAERICTAVNNHQSLKDALETLLHASLRLVDEHGVTLVDVSVLENAQSALQNLVEEKSPLV